MEMPSHPTLHGATVLLRSDEQRREVIEKAFDYRGDVTLTLHCGDVVEGYLFDRRQRDGVPEVRVMTPAGARTTVPYADVEKLAFTGRDPAAGKSWETWVQKYVEKKKAGQSVSLEPEKLE
jgi:3-deoxy-D-arabino-heptulosonate 7-phosphate (DAHP) synthase class II